MIDMALKDTIIKVGILKVLKKVISLKRLNNMTHLILEISKIIEDRLNKRYNPTNIGKKFNKDRSNISEKIDKYKNIKYVYILNYKKLS